MQTLRLPASQITDFVKAVDDKIINTDQKQQIVERFTIPRDDGFEFPITTPEPKKNYVQEIPQKKTPSIIGALFGGGFQQVKPQAKVMSKLGERMSELGKEIGSIVLADPFTVVVANI